MDMVDFFSNEYNEEQWINYTRCFKESNIYIEGIPQDIVNAVVTILGDDVGYKWLCTPFQKFNGKNALDLLETPKGERALKAFIMRLPT